MTENVTLNAGSPWTITAIDKLRELWSGGVEPALIGHTLWAVPSRRCGPKRRNSACRSMSRLAG